MRLFGLWLVTVACFGASISAYAQVALDASATAVVQKKPDRVSLEALVTALGSDPVTAQQATGQTMQRMTTALDGFTVEKGSLDNSRLLLNPEYRWDNDRNQQVMIGYRVTRALRFSLENIDDLSPAMQALTRAGATSLNPPQFTSSAAIDAQNTALSLAVKRAQRKLTVMARAVGLSVASVDAISEVSRSSRPVVGGRLAAESIRASTSIATPSVGELTYTAEVLIKGTAN